MSATWRSRPNIEARPPRPPRKPPPNRAPRSPAPSNPAMRPVPKPNLRCGWACPTGAPGRCGWIWPGVVWVRWIGAAVEGAVRVAAGASKVREPREPRPPPLDLPPGRASATPAMASARTPARANTARPRLEKIMFMGLDPFLSGRGSKSPRTRIYSGALAFRIGHPAGHNQRPRLSPPTGFFERRPGRALREQHVAHVHGRAVLESDGLVDEPIAGVDLPMRRVDLDEGRAWAVADELQHVAVKGAVAGKVDNRVPVRLAAPE